jgi:hypothetical protein
VGDSGETGDTGEYGDDQRGELSKPISQTALRGFVDGVKCPRGSVFCFPPLFERRFRAKRGLVLL